MSRLNKFLFLLLFLLVLLILQESGIISWNGVRANLLLVFFTLLLSGKLRARVVFTLLLSFLILVFFDAGFWLFEAAVFSLVVAAAFFLRRILTGRVLFDFAALLLLGTAMFFYGAPFFEHLARYGFALSGLSFSPARIFLTEVVLNFIAGMVFMFLGSRRPLAGVFEG